MGFEMRPIRAWETLFGSRMERRRHHNGAAPQALRSLRLPLCALCDSRPLVLELGRDEDEVGVVVDVGFGDGPPAFGPLAFGHEAAVPQVALFGVPQAVRR